MQVEIRVVLASGVLLALVSACTEHSDRAPMETQAAPTTITSTANAKDNSVRAYIDPKTGALRDPTPEELTAEAAAESKKQKTDSTSGGAPAKPTEPHEVTLPNGAVEVVLDKSAQQPFRACIQKDGAVKMDHDCEATPTNVSTPKETPR